MLPIKKSAVPKVVTRVEDGCKRSEAHQLGCSTHHKRFVHKRFLAVLSILLVSLTLTGCVQAVRTGVTDGISRGFQNTISDIVEGALVDILNTP